MLAALLFLEDWTAAVDSMEKEALPVAGASLPAKGRGKMMIILRAIKGILVLSFNAATASAKTNVGGQAVIEGVMMKGPSAWSVAVRGWDGEVHVKREGLRRLPTLLKLPVLRGMVALFQAFSLGIKAIDFSASKAYEDDEGPMSPVTVTVTFAIAFVLGAALFVMLPLYLTRLAGIVLSAVNESSLLFNVVDGLIRVGVFLLYVSAIGLWGEMRRIYEYHGAEHKVIHAYESGGDLVAGDIRTNYSARHPRCGTSFLLIVMIISIFVFSVIPHHWSLALKFLSRVVLIPMIAGLSYEVLRYTARKRENAVVRAMTAPGLLLQRLTTREPDESQVDVALTALREVVEVGEGRQGGKVRGKGNV